MPAKTKYDMIMEAICRIETAQIDTQALVERVEMHHKTLYGNGSEGLCELIRGLRKDIDALKEVINSNRNVSGAENGVTFKWLTEKIFLPILLPLLSGVTAAAVMLKNIK